MLNQRVDEIFGDAVWSYPVLLVGAALLAYFLVRFAAVPLVYRAIARTPSQWDDLIAQRGIFKLTAYLAPAIILYVGAAHYPEMIGLGRRVILAFIFLIITLMLARLLTAAMDIYQLYPVSAERPIKGYIQLGKLLVYLLGAIIVISILVDRSPWGILGGLGAITAVLLLVFRDTILSLIASIQLVSNDLVRKSDWIEMPQFGVDGEVVDMALHSVKVRNWDNTYVSIPTYKIMENSFKNWRGMSDSGGRRIKRSLLIDQASVKFCDDEMMSRFKTFKRLESYLKTKQAELASANAGLDEDEIAALPINRRALTNLGTFRAYCQAYLEESSRFRNDMTLMVRQLAPSAQGLPLEIYAFTNDTNWVRYEGIQSDLIDHLLSVLPFFELKVFQNPTGADFSKNLGPRYPISEDKRTKIDS
ncbi:MAG: mechanosensitive ion channel protein MscS [Rhodospirillaceae bacterium]|nr:mechanosensitive ion channel protein MscS [Alphaproteobacteria bacterium]MBR71378.1 mechanosensitive ion channel protein MscS [Rhodospirillaceae bacterium]